MRFHVLRLVLSFGALLGVAAGCASGGASAPKPSAREKSTVTAEDIERGLNDQPLQKLLQGRVAGVTVGQAPDGSISVRIRGTLSIHGSNEPLYILDGVPIYPGPNGTLTGVNPSDVEWIKVLKDAAETAMYGSRGANGVILIKTKRSPKPVPDSSRTKSG